MLRRWRVRASYSNVVATIALILAAGGSAYAGLNLPRHSVGRAELKSDAVGSRVLRDRGVRRVDIAPATRRSLRGQRGPRGPAGSPAVSHFAAMGANGDFLRGDVTHGGHTAVGSGIYTVGFAESVSACAYSATLGSTDGTAVPAGRVTVTDADGLVEVRTFDASGVPADLPFHLIVAC